MSPRALILAVAALAAAAAPAYRTISRDGYCRFQARSDWSLKEDWKSAEPGATLTTGGSQVKLSVRFYRDGDAHAPSAKAYRAQIERPNNELEKTVRPEKPVGLDGKAAVAVHMELWEPIWGTMRVGPKVRLIKDFLVGEYPGGFYVLSISAPRELYSAAHAEFERFLKDFRFLAPAAPAPATSGPGSAQ